jgi:hypothetical protein
MNVERLESGAGRIRSWMNQSSMAQEEDESGAGRIKRRINQELEKS